jgi:hypothetical protein
MDVAEMEIMRAQYEEKEARLFTTAAFCNCFRSLRNVQYILTYSTKSQTSVPKETDVAGWKSDVFATTRQGFVVSTRK